MNNVVTLATIDEITGLHVIHRKAQPEFLVLNGEGRACATFDNIVKASEYLFNVLQYNGWIEEI